MSGDLVVFDDVRKSFGEFVAVKQMNLTIGQGEFVAIMGPSGCGKTTTLRMLAGLEAPSTGEIRLDGRVMNDVKPHERDTPMVWQSLALFPFLSARENVEFGLRMRGVDKATRTSRAMDWLDRMGIAEFADRNVATLSGGQRQRVALARALVMEPQILLLDEPLSALDAHLVIRMQAVLTQLQRELGITFVYVTHSQSEAFAMADRVVIMSQGEIAQIGTPKEIYRAPANRFVAEFVGRNNILSGTVTAAEAGQARIATPSGTFTVHGTLTQGQRASFAVSADLVHVHSERPEAENTLGCRLLSEEFVGSVVTLFLESEDGHEFKVQMQERQLSQFDLKGGEALWLDWQAAHAHILDDG
ncbi:ABC transporter ATP-binding protein [uncultured Roseobacter sp.]|uniref:ABC transporter ATP-binding protein n=1 Tax=uncultured Roseobacter sp. TaxID=114847 RepID=UPI00262C41BB|nr:ABC transporter ATP-binding protein [uncultured Roseobacter sp.]